ncbi:MAG: class I SAM-dependent methyltransferase [Acidimicrobiales bacterium]
MAEGLEDGGAALAGGDGPTAARPHYALGDNRVAGDRLVLLAEVFGPTSEAMLRAHAPDRPRLAVDLGCGPGHTTRLVARVTDARETVGLDASAAFVTRAAAEAANLGPMPGTIRFVHHDVTRLPWPVPAADLVFARYLLTHLPDPVETLGRWGTQLRPGGRLLVDEVERIDTEIEVFRTYLDVSGAMIAHYGAHLYVGSDVRDARGVPGLRTVASETATIAPSTAVVARIFAMNLATWRHDPYVEHHVDPAVVDALADGLDELLEARTTGRITWTHRQLVLERAPG